MRKYLLPLLAVLVGAGALAFLFTRPWQHNLEVKAYFENAEGLQAGAPVMLAGVEVGKVTRVLAVPEHKDHPAEVTLVFAPPYDSRIPRDAVLSVGVSGVLGGTLAELDISHSSGPPLRPGDVLATRSSPVLSRSPGSFADVLGKAFCAGVAEEKKQPTEDAGKKAR